MKSLKKILGIVLAGLMTASSFTACSNTPTNSSAVGGTASGKATSTGRTGDNQTITFWNVFTGSDGDILKSIVNDFNSSNKHGIKIEMAIMPNDQFQQKLPAAIATKTAPNMVLFGVEYMASYVKSNSLEDISDFWNTMKVNKSNYEDNVVTLSQVNGKQYGIPMQYNVSYLYWNKDLFKAAGLNPETPPATLDELATYAEKLTVPSKHQYGLLLPKGATYPQFLWANGGDVDDPSSNKNLLNSDANLKTLEWLQNLTVNKKVTPKSITGSEADTMFQSGQGAMYMSGPWQINGLRSQGINFGVTSVPKGSSGAYSPAGGCAFEIPAGTDSVKKAAAYEFMKFWLSDDTLKIWSQKNGFPVWSKTLEQQSDIKSDKVLNAITQATKVGRSYNLGYSLSSQIDNDAVIPMFESVISGSAKPTDALAGAAKKLDTILKSAG